MPDNTTPPIIIGRADTADITVDDPDASPTHCRLDLTDMGWILSDSASTNGTRVVRGRTTYPIPPGTGWVMEAGDRIIVGRTTLPPFTPTGV